MLLNRLEYGLMNNPLRTMVQRRFESRRLLRLGGVMSGGQALEVGCGRGVGAELILDQFGAGSVDAFDLDPRMVKLARARLAGNRERARVWVGAAEAIAVPDASYDAVFDFGIIHHVPAWRKVLTEVNRVLKPGGVFYAEEVLAGFINHPIARLLLEHPKHDRFRQREFISALSEAGLRPRASEDLWHCFGWVVAQKLSI